MSQRDLTEELLSESGFADDDLENDDYCFIFDRDGNLKGAVLPEVLPFKTPKNISKILKMMGVTDIAQLDQDHTLH